MSYVSSIRYVDKKINNDTFLNQYEREAREQLTKLEFHSKEIKEVFDCESLSWEEKYDAIFKYAKLHVYDLVKKLPLYFDDYYYDPDCSYQQDTQAFVQGLNNYIEALRKFLAPQKKATELIAKPISNMIQSIDQLQASLDIRISEPWQWTKAELDEYGELSVDLQAMKKKLLNLQRISA